MLDSIVQYTDDAAGLEKTLRLLQSICTIATGITTAGDDLAFWLQLRSQFALGRRYFRLLKWYPCWNNAIEAYNSSQSSIRLLFEVLKWSFLGLYFFLEALTITNALGATAYEWGPIVQREANKCWVYGLIASLFVSLYDLFAAHDTQPTKDEAKREKKSKTSVEKSEDGNAAQRQAIMTQLAIDTADLFIPGAAVGWLPVSTLFVGCASLVSSTLAGQQIWQRIDASNSGRPVTKT